MSSDFTIKVGLLEVQLLRGDITQIKVDAIVNAANSELKGGGGVDGAIHAAGGPEIMRDLDAIRERIGRCQPGEAVVTGAGSLPAKYVFHAVGPVYRDGRSGEPVALASCYEKCLELAVAHQVKTISFPSISTGVYRFPVPDAAAIAVQTVIEWLGRNPNGPSTIKLVQFDDADHQTYRQCALRFQKGHQALQTHG